MTPIIVFLVKNKKKTIVLTTTYCHSNDLYCNGTETYTKAYCNSVLQKKKKKKWKNTQS